MKYDIELETENCDRHNLASDLSFKKAGKQARLAACKYDRCNVFVTWRRASDGQVGYLNADGNHEITGKAW